jgi:GxxExxY protein
MNTDKRRKMDQRIEELTERVLGAVFEVANALGSGFLEKVYERALVRELGARGVRAAAQVPLEVKYKGYGVGEYFADKRPGSRFCVAEV